MTPIRITLAQLDFTVGAITRNTETILATLNQYETSDCVIFPELAITGYSPEDLLLRDDLLQQVDEAVARIAQAAVHQVLIVGHPHREGGSVYNSVSVLHQGQCLARYHKRRLPQTGVFDEQRYFTAGQTPVRFQWQGKTFGLLICEDLWHPEPLQQYAEESLDALIVVNASPYEVDKHQQRLQVLQQRHKERSVPIFYVNHCGGQDDLVFDGHSLVLDQQGQLLAELPHCEPACASLVWGADGLVLEQHQYAPRPAQNKLAEVYQALVLAVRDYVRKNGFQGVTIGLSGGIDSALTLAIAVDALGADKVHAVMMPFRYTSQMSQDDAAEQAQRMGVRYDVVPIEPIYEALMQQLAPLFAGMPADTTEENLQARARGTLLMAVSNKTQSLVLTTGNKSELAVGYCTLYGDMNGGFAPLRDVSKTLVFELSRYRNTLAEVIPERVITRPPSAELAPGQVDQDSLPEYEILDQILSLYVEQDWSAAAMIQAGFNEADVLRVIRLVDINEYKRRQGAVGPKITARNFGHDRRYPITNHYRYELERQVRSRSSHEKN